MSGDPDLDTIDGVERRVERGPGDSPRPAFQPQRDDYPELATIERIHYVVEREIARGGVGRILEARDRRLGRRVAIKELQPQHRDAARRFEREARITARLQHPSIIHIYEAGTWPGGEPFFAMTHVTGRSLDKVCAERRSFDARIALLPNVIAVADALAYAHSERVIHRDLKPSNVLIGEFGETVVIDWGLAKDLGAPPDLNESLMNRALAAVATDTAAGSVVGTPAYMPPEQARSEAVDERADVYALGGLLYHVLVGAPPFTGASARDVLDRVQRGAMPPPIREREPSVPRDLVAIVTKAMALDPADRYEDAAELASDLKRFQTGQLVAAHHYTTRQLTWRWLARNRLAITITTVAIVTLAVAGTVAVRRVVAEKDRAEDRRVALLEERGRSELQANRYGPALAYLTAAAEDGEPSPARGFLIADAMRPFQAEVRSLDAGPGSVVIAVGRDGVIATAGSGPLRVWSRDGDPLASLGSIGTALALAFAPDGAHLAIAGTDGVAWIVPVGGGDPIVLRGHAGRINGVAWSPDGKRVVTAGGDHTARVWNAATGALISWSDCHTDQVTSAQFSPDGVNVATSGDDALGCVWDASSGDRIAQLRGHSGPVKRIQWTSDGTRVVTAGTDGTARVWDPLKGPPVVAPISTGGALALAVPSPDDRVVLTAGLEGIGRVWRLPKLPDDGEPPPISRVAIPRLEHSDQILDATFSPSGDQIATGGQDRVARVWDANTGQLIETFEHADAIGAIAFAGENRLVTGSRDGTVRIWDLSRGVGRDRRELDSLPLRAVAVSADGHVATGGDDGRVWSWLPGHEAQTRELRDHMGSVFAVAFSPDGQYLVAAGQDQHALLWNAVTGAYLRPLGDGVVHGSIHAIAVDGERVALASDTGIDLVALSGQRIRTLPSDGGVDAIAVGAGLLVGSTSKAMVNVWSLDGGIAATAAAQQVATPGAVNAIAFSKDGAAVVLAGAGFAHVHAIVDGAIEPETSLAIEGPTGVVVDIAFTGDGSRIVTASTDGSVRVWDAARGKLLGVRVVHGATSVALAPDDSTMWVAGEDGGLTAFDIHVAHESWLELDGFMRSHRLSWRLGEDDVIMLAPGSAR